MNYSSIKMQWELIKGAFNCDFDIDGVIYDQPVPPRYYGHFLPPPLKKPRLISQTIFFFENVEQRFYLTLFLFFWGGGGREGAWVGELYSQVHSTLSVTFFLENRFLLSAPEYTSTPTQFSTSQVFCRHPHGPVRHVTANETCFSASSVA